MTPPTATLEDALERISTLEQHAAAPRETPTGDQITANPYKISPTGKAEQTPPEGVVTGSELGLISPLTYGAKFNGARVEDAAIESGKTTLEAPQFSIFTVANTVAVAGAGPAGTTLFTTITNLSAGSVTLATAASTTVTGATALYGTDDSAAWKALAESLLPGRGYRITCPEGRSLFNNITFGSTVSKQGITLEIIGAGDRATFLTPLSAAGIGTMMTVNGPGDSTSSSFKMRSLTVGFDFPDPIIDFPYTQPFVHLVGIEGFEIDCHHRVLGTGTIWKLDGTYVGKFSGGRMQTGRYGVGIEIDDEVASPPQEDTIRFGETFAHEGNFAVVQRNIEHSLDCVVLPQFKSAVYTPTHEEGRELNGHEDREHFSEGHLAEEAAAAASTLKLEAGQAATMGYETANLPLPIMIDYGDHVEINKVTAAAGDILTLRQPLRWAHAAAAVVVRGTCALNYPTNVQSVTIGPGCHLEGHSCAGVQLAGGKLITIHGGTSSCRALARVCGGAEDVKVSRMLMTGASAWLGAAAGEHNIAIEVPAWNTNASLSGLYTEDLYKNGAEPVLHIYDPGANAKKVVYRKTELPSGVPSTITNVPTGDATSTSTLVYEELLENGETTIWQRLLNGATVWRKDARMKRRGPGSIIFEYWNGAEWVESKAVAIGAAEVRFGEDTIILRKGKGVLETGGSFIIKGGVITAYLTGASVTAATDKLIEEAGGTPANGMLAVLYDTTGKHAYLAARAEGTWHPMGGPS